MLEDSGFTPATRPLRTIPRNHDASKIGNRDPGSPFRNGSSCEGIKSGLVRRDIQSQPGGKTVRQARERRQALEEVLNPRSSKGVCPAESYADPLALDPLKRLLHRNRLLWRGGQDHPGEKHGQTWETHGEE